MSELREFYNERKNEVEQFCIFLNKIEDDITYSSNMSILKSQAIIIIVTTHPIEKTEYP